VSKVSWAGGKRMSLSQRMIKIGFLLLSIICCYLYGIRFVGGLLIGFMFMAYMACYDEKVSTLLRLKWYGK
jgi:hypothetical protein